MWSWFPSMLVVTALACGACGACGGGAEGDDVRDPLTIRVKGSEFQWHVLYPGPDGEFATADDVLGMQDVHVPERTTIVIELSSEDYIYGFRIPDFGINKVAVPDLEFSAEFRADSPGSHVLKGDQMCGYQHKSLLGRVLVHSRSDYHDRLANLVSIR